MEIVRHARPLVDEVRSWARVCVINGPRQCGKSTLLRAVHATTGGDLVLLDDPALRSAARHDPVGFLQALSRPTTKAGGHPAGAQRRPLASTRS